MLMVLIVVLLGDCKVSCLRMSIVLVVFVSALWCRFIGVVFVWVVVLCRVMWKLWGVVIVVIMLIDLLLVLSTVFCLMCSLMRVWIVEGLICVLVR